MEGTGLASSAYFGFIYVIILSIISFILMYLDKKYAIYGQKRIPEGMLLFFAVIGGSIGEIFGMIVCHHKTRKPKFYIGLPVILGVQVFLLIIYFSFFKV